MAGNALGHGDEAYAGRSHTRPGVSARDPLLYWTVARWRSPDKPRDAWWADLDNYALSVAGAIGLQPYAPEPRIAGVVAESVNSPHRSDELEVGPTAHRLDDIVTYEFIWWSAQARLRFERHTEYWIESLTLDFSTPALGRFPAFASPGPRVEDCFATISQLLGRPEPSADSYQALRDGYAPCSKRLLSDLPLFAREAGVMCADQAETHGEIFADLRGLVLGEAIWRTPDPFDRRHRGHIRARCAFWRDEATKRLGEHSAWPPTPADWEAKARLLWPFVSAPIGDDNTRTDFEYAASVMVGDRALHLSALGAAHAASARKPGRPVYSWFLVHGLSDWAIARLVDVMCQQGVLRLAAVRHYDLLYDAADVLHKAETELINAATLSTAEDLAVSLREVQHQVSKGDALLKDGGVGYRVQRSGYYVAKFFSGLPRLNIRPVGDFQSYESFLRATTGSAFSFIEVLGARYERIRRDERLLVEQLRSARLLEIQQLADGALLTALLPYYLGTLISHAVWPSEHGAPGEFWALCVFTGFAGAAFRLEPAAPPRGPIDRRTRSKRIYSHCIALVAVYGAMFCATGLATIVIAGLVGEPLRGWLGGLHPDLRSNGLRLVALSALPVLLTIAEGWPTQRLEALRRDWNAWPEDRSPTRPKAEARSRRPKPRRFKALSLRAMAAGLALAVLIIALFAPSPRLSSSGGASGTHIDVSIDLGGRQ